MLIGIAHTAPFHVDPRNLLPLSIQLDIPVPRVSRTHEAPGFEGESEPASLHFSLPPQKSGRDQPRIGDPPARQELIFKPENTTGDVARFILLFQGDQ